MRRGVNEYMTKQITTGFATIGLLASIFAPAAFADTTITIGNNGADSENTVRVKNKCVTNLTQTNHTLATTSINLTQNTGGNQANNNTGEGDVTITTGAATANITVAVTGGDNTATVDPCCCLEDGNGTTVDVVDNGAGTTNLAKVKNKNKVNETQTGLANGTTGITGKQKTGKNKNNNNTGAGNKSVTTGPASATVGVAVTGGSNTLNP